MHDPPMQVWPMEQLLPQRPQLLESLINAPWLMQDPMHEVYPGPQLQEPPVHVSENEQWLPQRPQLLESLIKLEVLTQLPWQYSSPAGQSKGLLLVPMVGGGCGRGATACTGCVVA
jgi:hypothetical protein